MTLADLYTLLAMAPHVEDQDHYRRLVAALWREIERTARREAG